MGGGQEAEVGEVRARFFTARASGATLKQAVAAAGVSKTTGHYWLTQSGGVRREIPGEAPGFGSIVDLNSFYGYGRSAWHGLPDRRSGVAVHPDEASLHAGGHLRVREQHRSFQRPSPGTRGAAASGRCWPAGPPETASGRRTSGTGTASRSRCPARARQYSKYAFQLFASMPWWELQPSGTDTGFAGIKLVPTGGGTWGKPDYITAALTAGHDWLLAYVPVMQRDERTFSIDMSALNGPARARWFDPATGNYLAISDGHEYENSGLRRVHNAWDSRRRHRRMAPRPRIERYHKVRLDHDGRRVRRPGHEPGRGDCKVTAADVDDLSVVASEVIRFSNG